MAVLNSTAEFWQEIDNEAYYTDLLMAIEFSDRDRVSLFIAVCDVDRVQSDIINKYTEQLKPDFQSYQIAVNSNNLNPVRSIAELVDREPYLQAGGKAVISVVGATSLASVKLDSNADKPDRDTFFGYLQWTRESYRNFHLPIVFWVSKNIYNLMLSETPDFWSWRNGVFFFKADLEIVNKVKDVVNSSNLHDLDLGLAVSNSIPLPDLIQLIERTVTRNSEDPLLVSLYNQVANLYVDRLGKGKYDDYLAEQNLAIKYLQKAINLAPESSQDLAMSLNNLGSLYHAQSRYAETEPLFLKSLAISEEKLGANHPNTATSLNNIAGLYKSMDRYTEAEPLLLRSLAISEEKSGANHADTATSLNNLASLYQSMGRYTEAEPLFARALTIRTEQLGVNHPDTSISLNNLALLYQSIGRYAEAKPLFLQALAISEEQLGANHPNTATILNNLASCYCSMNRDDEAEPLLVRAVNILERSLGSNHPTTQSYYKNLQLLRQQLAKSQYDYSSRE